MPANVIAPPYSLGNGANIPLATAQIDAVGVLAHRANSKRADLAVASFLAPTVAEKTAMKRRDVKWCFGPSWP
jgi:hypothetical protein